MNKYAIVGFGYAGYEAASAIRRIDPNALIDVYSDTELPPYNPMLITYFAKGDIAYKQMFPFGDITQIAGELKLNYRGVRVNKVIPGNMSLSVEHGETESYDGILIR